MLASSVESVAVEAVAVVGPTYGAAVVVGAVVVEGLEASSTAAGVALVGTVVAVVVAAASEPLVVVPYRSLVASS